MTEEEKKERIQFLWKKLRAHVSQLNFVTRAQKEVEK